MVEWIESHETAIWWLAGGSLLMFLAAPILIPLLVARIPHDYFSQRRRQRKEGPDRRSVVRWGVLIAKNLLGYVFIVVGILLLVLPGQGMLTILIGVTLVNFPGKYRLGRWIVSRRPVFRSVNWLRRRAGRPPLSLEDDSDPPG